MNSDDVWDQLESGALGQCEGEFFKFRGTEGMENGKIFKCERYEIQTEIRLFPENPLYTKRYSLKTQGSYDSCELDSAQLAPETSVTEITFSISDEGGDLEDILPKALDMYQTMDRQLVDAGQKCLVTTRPE